MLLSRIKMLCDKKGITLNKLEKEVGLSQYSISKWEKSSPKVENVQKIAQYFNVSTDYLLGNDKPSKPFIEPESEEVIFMPIIARITAGFGKMPEEEYTGEKLPIPKYMINGDPDNYFILQVSGDSMYPRFFDGDTVLMEKTDFCDSGQTAAIIIDGEEATLKKVEYDENKTYIKLIPNNTNYAPKTFKGEEMNEVRVIGVVKRLIREEY